MCFVVPRPLNWPPTCFFVRRKQVYPIGIPILYAVILWKNRELLNPRIVRCNAEPDSGRESMGGEVDPTAVLCTAPKLGTKKSYSPEELGELEERVLARKKHPELVPSMFLWKDFGEICEGI